MHFKEIIGLWLSFQVFNRPQNDTLLVPGFEPQMAKKVGALEVDKVYALDWVSSWVL